MNRSEKFAYFVPIATTLVMGVLALALDFFFGRVFIEAAVLDVTDIERQYRVASSEFHHGLRPNFSTDKAVWGGNTYSIRTNSLGFRDEIKRDVGKIPNKRRIVFIGDSFTEGVGLNWDQTFVGIFARSRPDLEVLNAGVSSYSPAIYLRKLSWLLERGYKIDEVVVYIDISDIQDEGYSYTFDGNGGLEPTFRRCPWTRFEEYKGGTLPAGAPVDSASTPLSRARVWAGDNFPVLHLAFSALKARLSRDERGGGTVPLPQPAEPPISQIRGMWTFEDKLPCYGSAGVEGAIRIARAHMTSLARLLSARGIPLSIGVYPWPDQLVSDSVDSRQVQIWDNWCRESGCRRFINHFPDFFARRPPGSWPKELYLPDDSHLSVEGNKLVATKLLSEMAK